MNDLVFVNEDELMKSVDIINGYVSREETILNNISDTLRYGFDGTYTSNNFYNLRAKCFNLKEHSSKIVSNNKKITSTFRDVCQLYNVAARKGINKLQNAEKEYK